MPEFRKYPSLINVEHKADVSWWVDTFGSLRQELYVVREKIDGANLQVLFMPDGVYHVGRRTDWLSAGEKFYDYRTAIDKSVDLINAFQELAVNKDVCFRAYFELYGNGINRRVKYGNDGLRLCLLDVSDVDEKLDVMWDENRLQEFVYKRDLHNYLAPIIGTHRFDDAIGLNLNFNSKILDISDNQAEGVVIKPLSRNYYNGRGERFVLKAKHPDFGEVIKKPRIAGAGLNSEQLLFKNYLNDNRVLSVFSKHGKIERIQQLGDYIRLVMNDAVADFCKDNPQIDTFDKSMFGFGGNIVAKLLKQYL